MSSFRDTSDFGSKILKIIGRKKDFKVKFSNNKYKIADALFEKNGKTALVEHKYRHITDRQLIVKYNNELLLEESKYNNLLKYQKVNNYDYCFYITTIMSGDTFIFNLNHPELINCNKDIRSCPDTTSGNKNYVNKKLLLLDVNSIYCQKMKIDLE